MVILMFRRYEIKKVHGEERLYIHLDMSYEIAKINKSNNKTGIINQIIDYVKVNNIKFSGTKIVLVVGGLVLGTVFLNSSIDTLKAKESKDITYVDKIFLNSYTKDNELDKISNIKFVQTSEVEEIHIIKEDTSKSNDENKDVINKVENNKETNKIDANNQTNNTNTAQNKQTTNENTATNNNSTNQTTKPSAKVTPKSSQSQQQQQTPQQQQQQATKNMVTIYRSTGIIQEIEFEEYIIGVVAAEMPASFNEEALKVQAIIARTYALKLMQSGKVLTDTTSTQVYKDNSQLKTLWGANYNTYFSKIKKAVDATKDMKITYNGKLIEALYFSCSNGYTEDAINVWGNSYNYLKSVESKWDIETTAYLRETPYSFEQLSKTLGLDINSSTHISINNKNTSNRVSSVTFENKNYTGVELRTLLGLRSADFDIEVNAQEILITTRGYGHGVGLSQYGAHMMANAGYNYSQIIKHYYQGTTITK